MKKLILISTIVLTLAACGGGNDDNTPSVTAQVPTSASASTFGFISYLQALIASTDVDLLEPVDVNEVIPPEDNAGASIEV